jgi:hypothetical protein
MIPDHLELLDWMVERELRESGGVSGAALLSEAGELERGEEEPWEGIARRVELLDGMRCLSFRRAPGEPPSGPTDVISLTDLQAIEEIRVTYEGHTLHRLRVAERSLPSNLTIIDNTTIGQARTARQNRIADVRVLIALARRRLQDIDAPEEVRVEAATLLERLQDVAKDADTPAAALVANALQGAMSSGRGPSA